MSSFRAWVFTERNLSYCVQAQEMLLRCNFVAVQDGLQRLHIPIGELPKEEVPSYTFKHHNPDPQKETPDFQTLNSTPRSRNHLSASLARKTWRSSLRQRMVSLARTKARVTKAPSGWLFDGGTMDHTWVVIKIMAPFGGTLNIRCRTIIGIQKRTIILTTTHMESALEARVG